jgi:hypothetical protein
MRVESTGYKDTKRIMDGEVIVGLAIQYANGFWAPHGHNDMRLAPAAFKNPTAVRKWFEDQPHDRA